MKPGFMSSVCPRQTLPELIATAQRYGFEGLEFRVEWGHAHGIELGASIASLQAARCALAEAGIAASCLATSVKFNSPNPADHLPQRDTLRRYVELAAAIGAPYIRTFSDAVPEDDAQARDAVLALAAESYAASDAWAGQHGVTLLVETHTNMRAHWARRILDQSAAQHLAVLWHPAHHIIRGQSVAEAYGYLRGRVGHVHFAHLLDQVAVSDAEDQAMFRLLAADGFAGFISVEVINPANPDAVLTEHMGRYQRFLADAA